MVENTYFPLATSLEITVVLRQHVWTHLQIVAYMDENNYLVLQFEYSRETMIYTIFFTGIWAVYTEV